MAFKRSPDDLDVMTYEPTRGDPAWRDRLGSGPNGAVLLAVIVATVAVAHGIVLGLLEPPGHHSMTMAELSIVLWAGTSIVAACGLAVLGWAYLSVVDHLATLPRVDLEILPEDERQVLTPIVETPGITQVEVVARTDYSDAKVSQTLKSLRERGLVYREPQGRTYRLYPGTVVGDAANDD